MQAHAPRQLPSVLHEKPDCCSKDMAASSAAARLGPPDRCSDGLGYPQAFLQKEL